MPSRPEIAVVALGGTIAMTPDTSNPGAVPRLGADQLVAAVPGLGDVASIRTRSFRQVPGAHLTLADVVALAEAVDREVASGADGVVITQGTDTLEEVAFALDLLVRSEVPLILTGAMRPAHLPGADGPANLLDAVQAAASPRLGGVGAVVLLGGEIHAARFVVKAHTQSPAAFSSPLVGPLGWVAEERPRLSTIPAGRAPLELPRGVTPSRVALLSATLGDDGTLVRATAGSDYQGLVIEALGGGHLPEAMLDAVEEAIAAMPVVLASRTQAGEILRLTYGFAGSERDLIARGCLSAAWLNGRKARILLAMLLGDRDNPDAVAERLERYLEAAAPIT